MNCTRKKCILPSPNLVGRKTYYGGEEGNSMLLADFNCYYIHICICTFTSYQ